MCKHKGVSTASDLFTYGPVHLNVTDGVRSRAFWEGVAGLEPTAHDGDGIALGAGTHTLVVLHPGATQPTQPGHSGLYHLALHVPDAAAFGRTLLRVAAARYHQAPTDHITHWATYLDDPDGIQLEVAFETIERVARYESGPEWPLIVDTEGRQRNAVEALDVEHVLTVGGDTDPSQPMAPGTIVGHLHLHVDDLAAAQHHWAEVVGMTRNVEGPRIGFADLSAGGRFPHRMAVNTWQRPGTPAPEGTAGLRHFATQWSSQNAMEGAMARLDAAGRIVGTHADAVMAVDPSGNRFTLER